jgi:tetratricopeptide (TPR) repeat protein
VLHLVDTDGNLLSLTQALDRVDVTRCAQHKAGHRRANSVGVELLKRDALDDALACFVASLRHKMDFPPALYGVGETFARRASGSGFELAKLSYEGALSIWPHYVDAHIALGDAWSRIRGDRVRAETHYKRAVDLRPRDALSWEALANNQRERGAHALSIETYTRAIDSIGNGSAGLLYGFARTLRASGKYDECVQKCNKALDIASEYGQAWHLLALCSLDAAGGHRASDADVEMYFQKAVELEPEFAAHHVDLAWHMYNISAGERIDAARDVIAAGKKAELYADERGVFETLAQAFASSTKAQPRDEL